MRRPRDYARHTESIVLLFFVAAGLLSYPVLGTWVGTHAPWYAPFLLWAVIVLAAAWLQFRRSRHDL